MKATHLGTLLLLLSNSAFALNDLGSLDDARKNHPAIFVSGNVLEYTINKVNGYVYNELRGSRKTGGYHLID